MSKRSEISRDVDPNHKEKENSGYQTTDADDSVNGRDSDTGNKEGSTKPEQNQVSEDSSMSSSQDKNIESPSQENNKPASAGDKESETDRSPKTQKPGDEGQTGDNSSEQESTKDSNQAQVEQDEQDQDTREIEAETQPPTESEDADEDNVRKEQKESGEPAAASQSTKSKEPPKKPWEDVDFLELDKSELVKLIELLVKEDDPISAEKVSRGLKGRYDTIHEIERKETLDRFVADGNDPDHFAYRFDDLDNRFDGTYKLIRDRKSQYVKDLERNKEKNLAQKVSLLEELRALVDEEETISSIENIKKIQEKWKAVGPVPGKHVKTLWANYHALMDRYYDQRSIYFELKELDRKKNLEAKLELCEKAENLASVDNLKQAIGELNELHEEFKHIGPVPKEEQQALWKRFKHASDQIYAKRKEFIKILKEDLKENLNKKTQLAEEVQEYAQFDSDKITDWNKKTKAILNLQKRWEAIGGLPREHAREVNRKFWGAFKGFFQNKGAFFKKLEGQREANLEKKQELVKHAEELKDSTDWNKTAEKLKTLQKEWRNVGPVPEKYRNSVYAQFKEYCDIFFNNKRSQNQELEKEYIENLKQKQQICTEIEKMTTGGDYNLDKFLDLKQKFYDIGFVPASEIKNIRTQFGEAANDFLSRVPEELADEARQIKYDIKFEKLKKGPHANRRKEHKEQALRRDIAALENDIATWKNNLEFFANSKKANKVKEEFTTKIEQAVKKLKDLKSQLRSLRQL